MLCTVRERMALPRTLIERLPNLKLITIVGMSLPNLDMAAATEHGVLVAHSDFANPRFKAVRDATPELAWGLMIATVRDIWPKSIGGCATGGWQTTTGMTLSGKTLGLLGLGRIGKRMAEYAKVFGMEVIAWSQNLTAEAAAAVGVRRVEKDDAVRRVRRGLDPPGALRAHPRSGRRPRAGADEAARLPDQHLARPDRRRAALIAALSAGRIAGAGLDVFDIEPLPADHPLRFLPNVTLSPHLGYVTREMLGAFYSDTVAAVAAWLDGDPIRIANPDAIKGNP